MTTDWIEALPVADLPEVGGRLVRHGDKRIALFRTPNGIYATDNRCPHEGYALVQGDVKDGLLTCAWHNWKFELDGGGCVLGGEDVRTYPVEIRDRSVWLDVTDPPAEEVAPKLFASLLEAMGEVDVGRMARDTMRLRSLGVPLAEVVRTGVHFAAPKVEYGWNHSLATLTDCLNLAALVEGPLSSLPVLQGLAVASENEVRRPDRPRPDAIDPIAAYGDLDTALAAYPVLVDDERGDEAEALLRGLLAMGAPRDRVRHALLTAITDHFLGYGHPMIYAMKSFELLDRIGWDEADTVLGPLVPNMTLATRYDRLPYMRRFRRAWESADVDLDALARRARQGDGAPFDDDGYRRALLDGGPDEAFAALHDALRTGVPVARVIDETIRAASARLGRFDVDIDLDDAKEWGWLDVTHTLTYADALRWAWSVDPSPEVLRGVFHAAWFVQWTGHLDAAGHAPVAPHGTDDARDVVTAIRSRDPEGAVALVRGYAGPERRLTDALAKAAVEDAHTAPIMVAHAVKTSRAAIVESQRLGDRAPLAATARFLAAPKRERFVYNATLEAIAFVQGRSRGER